MTDSLFDILSQKDFSEPAEIVAIKRYIKEHFQEAVEVTSYDRDIVVTTPSAALTNTLRFHLKQLKQVAQTDKRIALRTR
jgi:hypothetical protein